MAEEKKTVAQIIKDLVKENLDQAIVIKAKDSQVIALIAEKENLISTNKDLLEVAKKLKK